MADGRYEVSSVPAHQDALLAAATVLRDAGLESQTEVKPGGVAVHWRGLDSAKAEKLAKEVPRLWRPLLDRAPLRVLEFDGGLEIRVAGPGKGDAVSVILKEAGPGAAVAYLGDDQTDEDAFRALKGNGLTALVRPQFRPTTRRCLAATASRTAPVFRGVASCFRRVRMTDIVTREIKGRVINVSNRLPVLIRKYASGARVERSSGGLATALEAGWRDQRGVWIGWAGDTPESTGRSPAGQSLAQSCLYAAIGCAHRRRDCKVLLRIRQ